MTYLVCMLLFRKTGPCPEGLTIQTVIQRKTPSENSGMKAKGTRETYSYFSYKYLNLLTVGMNMKAFELSFPTEFVPNWW